MQGLFSGLGNFKGGSQSSFFLGSPSGGIPPSQPNQTQQKPETLEFGSQSQVEQGSSVGWNQINPKKQEVVQPKTNKLANQVVQGQSLDLPLQSTNSQKEKSIQTIKQIITVIDGLEKQIDLVYEIKCIFHKFQFVDSEGNKKLVANQLRNEFNTQLLNLQTVLEQQEQTIARLSHELSLRKQGNTNQNQYFIHNKKLKTETITEKYIELEEDLQRINEECQKFIEEVTATKLSHGQQSYVESLKSFIKSMFLIQQKIHQIENTQQV